MSCGTNVGVGSISVPAAKGGGGATGRAGLCAPSASNSVHSVERRRRGAAGRARTALEHSSTGTTTTKRMRAKAAPSRTAIRRRGQACKQFDGGHQFVAPFSPQDALRTAEPSSAQPGKAARADVASLGHSHSQTGGKTGRTGDKVSGESLSRGRARRARVLPSCIQCWSMSSGVGGREGW